MARSLAHPVAPASAALAATKARHPASRLLPPAEHPARDFADVVSLLTGPWRIGDPAGFAAAMTHAATVAGRAVTDLAARDVPGAAVTTILAGLPGRPDLRMWWVSGTAAGHLHVEARAQAPANRNGPEVMVLAHLLEPVRGTPRHAPPIDHSWVLVVVGDGAGQVQAVVRAILDCPGRPRCHPLPGPAVRFLLAGLRAHLISPALEAEGASNGSLAAVVPFPFRGDGPPGRHVP